MSADAEVLQQAQAWSGGGAGVALATVVATWGSAPRPAGSHLAVNDRGDFVGSVSGGCVEAAVIGEAVQAIQDGKPRLLRYGVSHERAWEVGLACGGTIEIHVERVAPSPGVLSSVQADVAAKRPVVLALDLAGGARLVHPDAPAPAPGLDPALVAAAREAIARDTSGKVELAGATWFLRVYNPPVRVIVIGAVHVAQALAPMVRLAGYEVIVVDPRRAFATAARFEHVPVVQEWPEEALPRLGLDRRTAVVTLTHDPKFDDPALTAALRSDALYIGALGSGRTQAARRERLRAAGFGDADLARVHGPVGLPIGARSPGEIAVSILAQVVAAVRGAADRPPREDAP